MQTERKYKDADWVEATARGCDIVQLKYDGWNATIDISMGFVRFYSRTGRLFKEMTLEDKELKCVLVGEFMQGTQWSQAPGRLGNTYLYDCLKWDELDLTNVPYRDRYRVVRLAPPRLPSSFQIVGCHKIEEAPLLWRNHVETSEFEGLVYLRGSDDTMGTLYRQKRTITEDLTCTGFVEGMGKFAGTLGAIEAVTDSLVPIAVGGGFSDDQRREIWDNQPFYLGKKFEVEAKARFESGSLRHPNFVRWRQDK